MQCRARGQARLPRVDDGGAGGRVEVVVLLVVAGGGAVATQQGEEGRDVGGEREREEIGRYSRHDRRGDWARTTGVRHMARQTL